LQEVGGKELGDKSEGWRTGGKSFFYSNIGERQVEELKVESRNGGTEEKGFSTEASEGRGTEDTEEKGKAVASDETKIGAEIPNAVTAQHSLTLSLFGCTVRLLGPFPLLSFPV
jgi:hypothetical protein